MPDQSLAEKFGVRLPGGTTVFRQGDPGSSLYVIRSGKVRVIIESQGRRRMVATLGPGDFFGEMAVVTGGPRSATVEVIEDAALLKVPAGKLEDMVAGSGEVAIRLIRHLAERLANANRFIEVLLEDDLTARVILAIQEITQTREGSGAPDISERDLALRLGLGKSDIRVALSRLKRVGILDTDDASVVIKDTERLGEFLEFIRNAGKS